MDKEISPKLAWTAALLLTAINTYSFADRQLPSIMIPELKADLLLTDAQIGFLFGTVFAVFFGIATVIFGRLADTPYRKNVLIFAILAWSILTGLCGIAQQFWDLIIFRIGVGVGEAALGPIALVVFASYNQYGYYQALYGCPFILFGLETHFLFICNSRDTICLKPKVSSIPKNENREGKNLLSTLLQKGVEIFPINVYRSYYYRVGWLLCFGLGNRNTC